MKAATMEVARLGTRYSICDSLEEKKAAKMNTVIERKSWIRKVKITKLIAL